MKKTFVTNLALLMGVNLLIKPFWILGIDRGVQNTLGYEQYGVYANLFTFSLLFITLLDLGINNFTSSQIARNKGKLTEIFFPLLFFKILASVAYLAVTLTLGKWYGYDNFRIKLLLLLGFNQILSYFYLFFRSMVGGLQLYKTDALLSVTDRLLMIILCGLMLWVGLFNLTIESFIYAQTVSYVAAGIISFFAVKPHIVDLNISFNVVTFKDILRKMAPYALLSLLMTFYTRLDNIMIQKLLPNGDYHNGVYASAYRLLEAANMMAALVSIMLLPMLSNMIESRQPLVPFLKLVTSVMVIPALIFTVLCATHASEIMTMLYPHSNEYAIQVFAVVIFCFLAFAIMYVFGTLLTANQNLKELNLLALLALLLNLILNYLLIKQYEAVGAAIAALITQTFIALTNGWFAIKKLNLNFGFNYWLSMFFTSALIVSILVVSAMYHQNIWVSAIIILPFSALLVVYFGLVEPKEALTIMKAKLKSTKLK